MLLNSGVCVGVCVCVDAMARIAIKNALFFGSEKFSELIVPWATYTEPEISHVGLYATGTYCTVLFCTVLAPIAPEVC